jgi:hypothetical protein
VTDELGKKYIAEVSQVFMLSLKKLCEPQCIPRTNNLTIFVTTTTPFANLKWSTNESYDLHVSTDHCK